MQESENKGYLNAFFESPGCYLRVGCLMICFVFVMLLMMFGSMFFFRTEYTETTDVADYGNYSGTGAQSFVEEYIGSFFPREIGESFSNVRYSFKAENLDTYGFEAYLEFTIENTDEFNRYVDSIAEDACWEPFIFDPSFQEYSIENVLDLDYDDDDDPNSLRYHQIVRAKIRKILYSADTQTVIFVALGVYDGGGIGTNYLNVFFERFDIDPAEYVHTADTSEGNAPFDYSLERAND